MTEEARDRRSIEAFVRRLGAVPEPAMREALWRERLAQQDANELLDAVDAVLTHTARTGAWEVAYLALVRAVEGAPEATRDRLRGLAAVTGRVAILDLFVRESPARVASEDELRLPPLHPDREITLGERRWWARRPDRALIDRLLLDQDPGVIENLLQNPRVTEADVVRMAARRPTGGEALRLLFRHPRWGRRREVQLALVQNPYTPVDVGRALMAVLDREILARLEQEPSLHPQVRDMARAQLARRGRTRAEVEPPDATDLSEIEWRDDLWSNDEAPRGTHDTEGAGEGRGGAED